jgi:hypothetical protein
MNVIVRAADAMKNAAFGLQDMMLKVLLHSGLEVIGQYRRVVFRVPHYVEVDLRINIARHCRPLYG